MRVNINLYSMKDIILNISYNHYVQAFLYNNLDTDLRKELHNTGFAFRKRHYKLFTFSKLRNPDRRPYIRNNSINLGKKVNFTVSSLETEFIRNLCKNLLRNELYLSRNEVKLSSIDVEKSDYVEDSLKRGKLVVKMSSPVVNYSTDEDGKQYFYSPFEDDFENKIKDNLINKYRAYYLKEPDNKEFSITFKENSKVKKVRDYFKETLLDGYYGAFILKGAYDLLKLAYYTGIGSKNSQGFGCFNIIYPS